MSKLIIIAAIAENNAIGFNNKLLWTIPEDFNHLKLKTSGHVVIMGRKTFQSLKRPLNNRINIVITSDKNFQAKDVIVANSLISAIKIAKKLNRDDIFIVGGGQVYKEAIELVDEMIITKVYKEYPKAEVFFPKIDPSKWIVSKEESKQSSKNGLDFSYITYTKKI